MSCRRFCPSWAALLLLLTGSVAPGQDAQPPYRSNLMVGPSSGLGVHRFVPGRWNQLHFRLTNRKDTPVTLVSTAAIGNDDLLQYGRAVWLPPNSILETSYPIWIPPLADPAQDALELKTRIGEAGENSQILIRDDWGKLEAADWLRLASPQSATGILTPPGELVERREYDQILELVQTGRKVGSLPLPVEELGAPFLPDSKVAFDHLNRIVVADGRVTRDEASLDALRQWLSAGNMIWIMLDQLDPGTLDRLLGETCPVTEVDRVGLTSVKIQWSTITGAAEQSIGEFEVPVTFARVIPEDADVICSIDGWPAAFWLNYGSGRILVTTLAARGWLRRDAEGAPPAIIGPATLFAADFFLPVEKNRPLPAGLEPIVQEYVGYAIPARGLITTLLAGFAGLLTVFAAGLWRAGRLELLGLYGPSLALLVGGGLIAIGLRQRQAVPPTAVQLQIAETVPGGEAVRIRGTAGVYRRDSQPGEWKGSRGGWLLPDATGVTGSTRQLLWDDADHWRWNHLQHPAGLRLADFEVDDRLPAPLRVDATLGDDGLTGRIQLPAGVSAADALLITSEGKMGVTLSATGEFSAGPDSVFSRDQYVAADVLSNEQRRRARILELLLNAPDWSGFPHTPRLLFWSPPLDAGLHMGQGLQELGTALILAPLELTRPRNGTSVVIPQPLISYREARGPDGSLPQGLFDYRTRQWQERFGVASNWLLCRPPRELAPLELQRVDVVIRVAGPVGRLELAGWRDGQRVVLHSWTAPVGTLSAELTDMAALPVTADGAFLLQVAAGESAADRENVAGPAQPQREYWRIESLSLTVRGKTVPHSSAAATPAAIR